MRRILADYCGADGATLGFASNRHGKPYLIPRARPNLQFSVSHSGDCCMLAVQRDHAVGVDVEKLRDLPQAMDIVQSYFTPAESRALAALPETAQRDAFFVLWTHKEAIVKGWASVWRLTLAAWSLNAIGPANCGSQHGMAIDPSRKFGPPPASILNRATSPP